MSHYKDTPSVAYQTTKIRQETAKDNTLPLLRYIIYERWPNSRSKCPQPLFDFRNFRKDLTIEHGIILKCDGIVAPPTLTPDILKTIHEGHLGVKKIPSQSPFSCTLARNHK